MTASELPARPNLEQYKKQAKDLRKKVRSADPDALGRVRQYHPRLGKLPEPELATAKFALADAQLVLAREHGFDSWPEFARRIEALEGERAPATVWKLAENAVVAGDATMLERLLRDHEQMLRKERPQSSWFGGLTPESSAIYRLPAGACCFGKPAGGARSRRSPSETFRWNQHQRTMACSVQAEVTE